MSGTRRVRGSTIPSISIIIYVYLNTVASSEYGVPIEMKLWDDDRRPIAQMVDVTNEFGLKMLAEHNFLNNNNIAFSPYGLMGILVALYEGVDGDSSYQLLRAVQLPWNRNHMRIGFRDIHRTLKTYFVPEEGFLAGLALNNENVTFNESYKRILRFYGFDLENDQLPTFPFNQTESTTEKSTTIGSEISTVINKETTSNTVETAMQNKPQEEFTTIVPSTTESTLHMESTQANHQTDATTSSNTGTFADANMLESTTTYTTSSISTESTPQSTIIVSTELTTTETATQMTTDVPSSTTNLINMTIITSNTENDSETISQQTALATVALTAATMSNEVNTLTAELVSSTEQISNTEVTTVASTLVNTGQTSDRESTSVASTIVSTEQTNSTDSTTVANTLSTQNTQTATVSTLETQTTEQSTSSTTLIDSAASMTTDSILGTLQRRKKSIVDYILTNPPYVMDDYLHYRSFDIPLAKPEQNLDDKMFLANGLKSVKATYMYYDTVLEHAYLPHLEASALRLPLDSERYYLLVILPGRSGPGQLDRLLTRMARESDLSDIYAVLRPRRVKGIVPSFIVKGHVTLTTDLQKLGVRDVFEPRQRNFSPMTRLSGVYVRSIEQAVSVAIRKYRPDDHKKNRYVTNRTPVKFHATYPFLYFVMDASIHVSLMAGKMMDPLNSRIL